jgi:large subunit ribosomal protein L17
MFRNLAANLITHERIQTTDEKAKELRRVTERLITKAIRLGEIAYTKADELAPADRAKRLHAQRLVAAFLPRFGTRIEEEQTKKVDLIEKVFVDLAKRYKGRPGGYTRIVKLGPRRGDNASMSIIELLKDKAEAEPAAKGDGKKGTPKKRTKKATAAAPAAGGAKAG